MMKKTIIFTYLTVILLFAFLKTGSTDMVKASSTTWHVPTDFPTIQDAINEASPYDTIQVAAGTYHEHLFITKHNLTIVGENPSNTFIDGNGTGSVIFLTANNVTITGFTVQNGGFHGINMNGASNCTINGNKITSNEDDGIWISWGSDNNIISNNIMNLNGGHGIESDQSCSHNTIRGNLLAGNEIGILLSNCRDHVLRDNNMTGNIYNFGVFGSSPIDFIHDIDISNVVEEKPIYYLIDQSNLVIDSSTFTNLGYLALVNSKNITVRNLDLANNYQGILFVNTTGSFIGHVTASDNVYGIHLVFSSYNNVSNNLVKPSVAGVTGIYLVNSKYNTLAQNRLDSCQTGMYLISYSLNNTIIENEVSNSQRGISLQASSSGNLIYHNSFINNTEQAMIGPYSCSIWDNGYPSGGNFWSDYAGQDLDGDGIGDTAYFIDLYNSDNYPLMTPYILLGDVNHDGTVDICDLGMIGKAYGSEHGDSNWNLDCDLNYDGIADIFDLATVGKNYGKTS